MSSLIHKVKSRFFSPSWGWKGNYASWADAQKQVTGYDDDVILEKVKNALIQVRDGKAVYERDSVLFDHIEYSWPLLSALMLVAAKQNGNLSVIDFGGSLGSTYFQNRKFLNELKSVSWNIVEQEKFVQCGKSTFETTQLQFYYSIAECLREKEIHALISSSTIQYIEKPFELIAEMIAHKLDYIIFDLIPTWNNPKQITIQTVPPTIYKASYPCWILNEAEFIESFAKDYELMSSFETAHTIYINGKALPYKGYIFRRK